MLRTRCEQFIVACAIYSFMDSRYKIEVADMKHLDKNDCMHMHYSNPGH